MVRYELLKSLFKDVDFSKVNKVVVKGLTNKNYFMDLGSKKILYKELNQDFGEFIDRKEEKHITSQLDGINIYYNTEELFIRDYLEDYDIITPKQFNEGVIESFCLGVHKIHKTTLNRKKSKLEEVLGSEDYISKIRQFVRDKSDFISREELNGYERIIDYLQAVQPDLHRLIEFDKDKVVNCHNDLNMANILLNPVTNKVELIDFDYAQPNIIYYDFANMNTEFNYELSDKSPFFIYTDDNEQLNKTKSEIVKCYCDIANLNYNDFWANVKKYEMLTHYFWMLVSFRSITLDIELDLPEYVDLRFKLFKQLESEYLNN